jgi:hypothetical protein
VARYTDIETTGGSYEYALLLGAYNARSCRGQRAVGSCGAVFARITVEPLEFIGIDGAQHPRREGPLEKFADRASTGRDPGQVG